MINPHTPLRQNFTKGQELQIEVAPELIETYQVNRRGHVYLHISRCTPPEEWRKPLDRIRMDDPRIKQ